MTRARIDKDGWCRCGECGHKLFLLKKQEQEPDIRSEIEIKCHSCKELNTWSPSLE